MAGTPAALDPAVRGHCEQTRALERAARAAVAVPSVDPRGGVRGWVRVRVGVRVRVRGRGSVGVRARVRLRVRVSVRVKVRVSARVRFPAGFSLFRAWIANPNPNTPHLVREA